ncbi:MMPL family transporter [Amantichitinum ursilacus]|uniref:MMPL family protein n=1 Tax=Amantichitinum ursilacus TaxID=857265 RepID=A0A0N0XJZ0_9NEIS|nr:MMPL family transporter [Amantichitinum ursilacus]KPC54086.1 MMPL family protein [Amantichitinum ursilacus]
MTKPLDAARLPRWLMVLALLWLALVLGLGGALLWQRHSLPTRIDTDLFALLPRDQRNPLAEEALQSLARQGERHLVFMLGAADADRAAAAAQFWQQQIKPLPLQPQALGAALDSISRFYAPYRHNLLSPSDAQAPANTDWSQRALAAAYSPAGTGPLAWQQDPFGLYTNWLQSLAGANKVRPIDGYLRASDRGVNYVVLPYTLQGSAFSLGLQEQVLDGLEAAAARLQQQFPDVQLRRAGVILHAATAARGAKSEMSTIGVGSTLGVLVLALLAFRGLRPVALAALSVAVGSLVSTALVLQIYGHIHMLTLVFGTSLVGVAVDYSLLALAASIDNDTPVPARYRRLLPGMALAVCTMSLGYLGLALTPFPGLAQMAAFAVIGIVAAWLTVMLWFPLLASRQLPATPLSRWISQSLARWPRLRKRHAWLALPLLLMLGVGISRLQVSDDIRALSGIDAGLLKEQIDIGRVMGLPSPAQLFIVQGATPEQVLQREEALAARLAPFVAQGKLAGAERISRWLPSAAQQRANAAWRQSHIDQAPGLLEGVAEQIGLEPGWIAQQRQPAPLLTFDTWIQSPAAQATSYLWLGHQGTGYASVVLLQGLTQNAVTGELAQLHVDGVTWVDKVADISRLMTRYRLLLTQVLIGAYVLSFIVLSWRYRQQAWRVLLPPALATLLTLALLGLLGAPVQLLTVVTLLLVLGMGMDYGIFLLEHPQDGRVWLAVTLAAACTLLSFGLLALSHTPALHAFGLATLSGIGLVWLLAPLFRLPSSTSD